MKKKSFIELFSILLVLGLIMAGCDFSFLDELTGGSNSGSGSSSGSDSNQFAGTSWHAIDEGDTWTLSFTSSSWTLRVSTGESQSGSYTYNGNTATCKQDGQTLFTATISGNTLDAVDYDGIRLTFTKGSSSSGNDTSQGDSSGSGSGEIPTKPRNLKVIPDTESTMKLTWASDDVVTGYNIYRSIESSSSGFTKVGASASKNFTDTGLSPDKRYYYYVTAYNDSGESRASDSKANWTAVLAGTTRDNATQLKFGDLGIIYYFPPGADELWFYFDRPATTVSIYRASVWDNSYGDNYFTASVLKSAAYWDDDTTPKDGEVRFGTASAYDRINNDGRQSVEMIILNRGNPSRIYFKVFTSATKGTFELVISYG